MRADDRKLVAATAHSEAALGEEATQDRSVDRAIAPRHGTVITIRATPLLQDNVRKSVSGRNGGAAVRAVGGR